MSSSPLSPFIIEHGTSVQTLKRLLLSSSTTSQAELALFVHQLQNPIDFREDPTSSVKRSARAMADPHRCFGPASSILSRNANAFEQNQRTVYARRFPTERKVHCQKEETAQKSNVEECEEFHSRQTITIRHIDCQDIYHSLRMNRGPETTKKGGESANSKRSLATTRKFPTGLLFSHSPISSSLRDQPVDDNDQISPANSTCDMNRRRDTMSNPELCTNIMKQVDQSVLSNDQIQNLMDQLTQCITQLTQLLAEKNDKEKKRAEMKPSKRLNKRKMLLRENIQVKKCPSYQNHPRKCHPLFSPPSKSKFTRSDQDDLQRCLLIHCRDRSKDTMSKQRFFSPSFTHPDDQEQRFRRQTINTNGRESYSSCTWNHLPIKRYSSSMLSSSTMANKRSDAVATPKRTLMFVDDDYESLTELEQSLNRAEDD